MRNYVAAMLTIVNLILFLSLMVSKGGEFEAPWDGPAVVTVVLASATMVLAAVALGVALLAIWGYTTLREHAANTAQNTATEIAERVASKTASETADNTATRVVTAWLERQDPQTRGGQPDDESIADAYTGEGQ